jgi:hypothetical protein
LSSLDERVKYVPPKSMGFGHNARARTARQAWQKTLDFLDRHTLREMRREITFGFPSTAVDGPGEYLGHVREKLGPQTGQPPYHVWSLTSAEFELCLRLALDVDRWPRDAEFRFSFCYDFVWRQEGVQRIPREGAMNGVPKYSWMIVTIGSRKVFLQPSFYFPHAHDSDEIHTLLQAIGSDLPFRFSPHHFQRVYAAKRGNGYVGRKLPKDWLRCNS